MIAEQTKDDAPRGRSLADAGPGQFFLASGSNGRLFRLDEALAVSNPLPSASTARARLPHTSDGPTGSTSRERALFSMRRFLHKERLLLLDELLLLVVVLFLTEEASSSGSREIWK